MLLAGGQVASYLMAAEEGVDVVDCAFAPLSGVTSLIPGTHTVTATYSGDAAFNQSTSSSIDQVVHRLRTALGDPRWVETIYGMGYRLRPQGPRQET